MLEWLSAHTHRRSLRYRTAGFTYHEQHDHWECPEGEHLWPHEFDRERRLVRYRAKAHVCNGCPRKDACTDSDRGREIVRPLDPWPHSEAGRFHRGLSLMLVALALLVIVVGGRPQPRPPPTPRRCSSCSAAPLGVGALAPARPPRASVGLPGARRRARPAASVPARDRRTTDTWTLIRFLHLVALAFFVGGQLMLVVAVAPAVRRDGDDARCARSRGASGSAAWSRSSCSSPPARRWPRTSAAGSDDVLQVKLMLVVLVGVLIVLHIASPRSRALSVLVLLVSLAVVWLGVDLAH